MNSGNGTATIWEFESPYIAIARDGDSMTALSEADLRKCTSHAAYAICYQSFAISTTPDKCVHTLLLNSDVDTIKHCKTKNYELPAQETATNLGDGQWLITSANLDYHIVESDASAGDSLRIIPHDSCYVCVIDLQCGRIIRTPHLTLHSDIESCSTRDTSITTVELPNTMTRLVKLLPTPTLEAPPAERGLIQQTFLKDVKLHMYTNLTLGEEDLMKIALPIAMKDVHKPKPRLTHHDKWHFGSILGQAIFSTIISCTCFLIFSRYYLKPYLKKRFIYGISEQLYNEQLQHDPHWNVSSGKCLVLPHERPLRIN